MEVNGLEMQTPKNPNQEFNERNIKVLIVEDESEIRDLIALHLMRQNYKVIEASTVEEALSIQTEYDLLVLDWMLPGLSGLELLKHLRQKNNSTPVLMVTARVEPEDIVEGLESGADDYLPKPFEPAVLVARVRALLRRSETLANGDQGSNNVIQIGQLRVDLENYEAFVGSEKLGLTPSEFKLLATMAQNTGKVLTRDRLIQEVQGEGISVVGRTVDTHIFGLRKKLGECSDFIETIRGVGYRVKSI